MRPSCGPFGNLLDMSSSWLNVTYESCCVRGGGSDTMMDNASEIDESFTYWAEWVDAV